MDIPTLEVRPLHCLDTVSYPRRMDSWTHFYTGLVLGRNHSPPTSLNVRPYLAHFWWKEQWTVHTVAKCHYSSIVSLFIQYLDAQSLQCLTYTNLHFTLTVS
jgi:hypothetical protein